MAKPGRNDPCHCGSGKKYKKCCLPKEEAEQREASAKDQARREAQTAAHHLTLREVKAELLEQLAEGEDQDDLTNLTMASNAAVDLVHAGKLQEAEVAARDLLERFPEVHDGWDRLGMVHEARGEKKQAADCYRKAIEIIRQHPGYDPEFADVFVKLVDELDPPSAIS